MLIYLEGGRVQKYKITMLAESNKISTITLITNESKVCAINHSSQLIWPVAYVILDGLLRKKKSSCA